MFGVPIGNPKTTLVVLTVAGLMALGVAGLLLLLPVRPTVETARDYEECVGAIAAGASTQDKRPIASDAQRDSMMECSARFAGRRKPGGGYTYFDFMQDRNFDIAGPNPTAEERGLIDREYVSFLDMQRRERISAELAKKEDEELRVDLERAHQSVGRPLILTPKNPSTQALKRPPDRTKSPHCDDNLFGCSWSRLFAAVKDSFASSPRSKP
jgi:hypothetical protein